MTRIAYICFVLLYRPDTNPVCPMSYNVNDSRLTLGSLPCLRSASEVHSKSLRHLPLVLFQALDLCGVVDLTLAQYVQPHLHTDEGLGPWQSKGPSKKGSNLH